MRSFKGRGADFMVGALPPGSTAVCGSGGGNFGQAIAYAARRHGLRAEVFVPASMSPVKLDRMTALGATVHKTHDDPKAMATTYAAEKPERILVADGKDARISEGAGTIGVELLRSRVDIDTVVVPVGDGALATGVAKWIKAQRPDVRIVGVGTSAAPAMAESWRAGTVIEIERRNTFTAGISISKPWPEAVTRMRDLVDDMILVADAAIVDTMHLAARTLGVLLEPAGAAGLAAVAGHDVPGDVLAVVLTGANADLATYSELTVR
ncbi:pyridoxal-phosphate dependent enzyme [Kibdelosporangium philippinense]|uniref:Pyridoxal-phosphate dependent enzyme n=1 Tax=Kibdelosporangium philippinense TaxID=211113 RepID=A0ABS8Z8R4_9PSEU|nr:pyridoxal-phosphate dependent enzyme [Kibdelosporangium philippinense]MCE7004279.1 pyridoxal-phosphate dependent enzyme [Kibdelosporangium philippinense]